MINSSRPGRPRVDRSDEEKRIDLK